MRLPIFKLCCLAFITSIVIALSACDEEPNSENTIQSSLDTLMIDLRIAALGSNIEGLESVIASASKIRPVAQSQIQSKNLLLSTAKEKLAQLKFQLLSAKTTATLPLLTLAEDQAIQSSILRNVANTLSQINTIDGLLSDQITSIQHEKRAHFNGQLTSATSVLDSLSSQSEVSRNKADELLEEAELLLNNAEDAGLIEGHSEYKSGVKTLRKAQQETLSASTIELQSSMRTKPLLEDARAELESIASILHGMEHSDALLQQLRNVARKNASDFRTLADELDSLAAETMNSGIEASETLKQEWDALSTLVQDALRGANQSRSRSREIQQTSGIWKLDLEWTLGQIEEAKRSFLLEEKRTLQTFIELGIVTSKEKWRELSTSTNAEIEQATLNAMSRR